MKYQHDSEFKSVAISYIFIIIPFILLIMVKVLTGKYYDLLLTGDWSIASAMIYSSSIINVRSATRKYNGKLNQVGLDWFMAVTSLMSAISVTIYVIALMQPSKWVGVLQIVLFIAASFAHMKYGRLAYRLRGES
ncbi:hypothetical protein C0W92_00060 [Photobacterium angustum]|uniref:Uncharacterized protein n=1 Tax=Photobacterium angustum TaxID=661 RepID=A0A855SG09_PHOAN|nr:hypothetical protein [Photobacterium angustum]KJF83156.1 hypothetical protein UB36_00745 [Photobacterium damselae subsp. damselae]KJG29181.1 hypothetical protein UA69_15075 [Photobacterium angustum]KJG43001.1 hypothetical protein UA35_03295 [Photobacterium angustum]KJG47464.1 hypothetical protein UA31_00745 [Photobacterium angustum]KJG49293.1 hypothetical protein UA30_08900 [Photobacterium angustum]